MKMSSSKQGIIVPGTSAVTTTIVSSFASAHKSMPSFSVAATESPGPRGFAPATEAVRSTDSPPDILTKLVILIRSTSPVLVIR
jgi:hypothetical protein